MKLQRTNAWPLMYTVWFRNVSFSCLVKSMVENLQSLSFCIHRPTTSPPLSQESGAGILAHHISGVKSGNLHLQNISCERVLFRLPSLAATQRGALFCGGPEGR